MGLWSNEHHISVIRGDSSRCAAVSFSAPVRLRQTILFGPMTRSDSMSFGAILTRPSGAAVPTKNIFCFVMKSWCASEISLNLGIFLGLLWCVAHFVSWRFCRELSSSDDKSGLVDETT